MKTVLVVVAFVALSGCKKRPEPTPPLAFTGEQVVIYQTRHDYRHLVPVQLSDDGSRVVAYPAPRDLYRNGQLAYPTELGNGYLLDNRGIGPNTAFLRLTYEQYSQLTEVPPLDSLYRWVADKAPLTTLCNCGARSQYQDLADFKRLVLEEFKHCKRLK